MFPSAHQIACAIVAASRFHGGDPLEIPAGEGNNRARTLAYGALGEAFPLAKKNGLARCLAFTSPAAAAAHLNMARKAKWWSETALDEIVGLMVAEEIEPPHFGLDERRLIGRMLQGGADATAIAAALGASPGEVAAWLREHSS